MPQYRYFMNDLLTNQTIGELELFGVYANKRLNSFGNFTGSAKLVGDRVRDGIVRDATQPGKTGLYMERDGELIWGGIIWTRTYNSQSPAYQFNAQTFESYYDHVVFKEHFIQQKVNQELIFQNMHNQLTSYVDVGIELTLPLPTTNTPRTILIPNYEFHFATDALQQLVNVDNGLEFTIDIVDGASVDRPRKVIRLGYPKLGAPNAEMNYDYPGNVSAYWLPESAANSGTYFAALGFGSGNKIARATAVDLNTQAKGYPDWWIVNQYSMIADVSILKDKVAEDARRLKMPAVTPQFELKADQVANFNSWNSLGDTFKVHVEDWRFPDGTDIESRMIGWELTPAAAGQGEVLRFTVEGE